MKFQLRPALVLLTLLTLLVGIVYPLAMTGLARVIFPRASGGTMIERNGKIVGSEHIGQPFDDPTLFWSRPSATSPSQNAAASTGANLGPSNPALHDAIRARIETLRAADPISTGPVPLDLVTSSASGLDPHISPAAARFQIGRVARARGLDPAVVARLVEETTERPELGFIGAARVNVLLLNLKLLDSK